MRSDSGLPIEGGPLISHGAAAEQQQRSFDATCRR
jgi:hypothetical protein